MRKSRLSKVIAGEAMMYWMFQSSIITGSIIRFCLQIKKNHINGIENFWNQAKPHMRKFNGIPAKHFPLFLKEYEWRFNNSDPKLQIKQLVKKFMGLLAGTAPEFNANEYKI